MADTPPKTFISYSWSNEEHQQWVLDLATTLMEAGVNVVLDKWDLREGEEASAFMERLVTDPTVTKVIIVSDRVYAEKSNTRKGGAGTEAQIISKRIFDNADSGKFVVVCRELDESGQPIIPAYYTSRVYISFVDEARRSENVEQLIRWLYDKPTFKRPPLGKAPHYILEDRSAVQLPTGTAARRASDALVNAKPYAFGATAEYFELLGSNLDAIRLPQGTDLLDEIVDNRLEDMIPYRDELIEVVQNICRYSNDQRYGELLHKLMETIAIYYQPPPGVNSWKDIEFDTFKFIGWEAFLYLTCLAFKHGRIDLFEALTNFPYINDRAAEIGRPSVHFFDQFSGDMPLFKYRNQQSGGRRILPATDILINRAKSPHISSEDLMEIDFILFARSAISRQFSWFPQTLIMRAGRWQRPFKSFLRSVSRSKFDELLPFLGAKDKAAFDAFVDGVSNGTIWAPKWNFDRVEPAQLSNHSELCSVP